MRIQYQKAYFLISVAKPSQLPIDQGREVAIVGYSNSGKSSVLNRITQQKQLARVSKTPGRTQMINMFQIDQQNRLVDLPGYGFAKAPPSAKRTWQATIAFYFAERKCLQGLVLVMDIRRPMKPLDIEMLMFCADKNIPVHILLNKVDKLSKSEANKAIKEVNSALTSFSNSVTLQVFSAQKGEGVKEFKLQLDEWFTTNST